MLEFLSRRALFTRQAENGIQLAKLVGFLHDQMDDMLLVDSSWISKITLQALRNFEQADHKQPSNYRYFEQHTLNTI